MTAWPAETLWEEVAPLLPGFTVEVLPEVDSTNSELMRRARAGQVDPILLVAEHQRAGRGRMGQDWFSTHTGGVWGLTFSLGLPLVPTQWSGLSLAVGLSLAQSLHPALQLKWPNDIYFQARKLAGILIETASLGDVRYAVIGVGINITMPAAQGLRTPPAALAELLPGLDAPATLARVVPPLVRSVLAFASQGFAHLQSAFQQRDFLYGQSLQCSDGTQGLGQGVDDQGALLVHTAAGLQKITSAEVHVRPVAPGSANLS
jgi:BirA family biotin operon repressor/biotin-[acetyl-CoA-carboxylase] ligase